MQHQNLEIRAVRANEVQALSAIADKRLKKFKIPVSLPSLSIYNYWKAFLLKLTNESTENLRKTN